MFQTMIKKSIQKSQHCQRNWDLGREIPEEDLDVLRSAVTECPSKQNLVYYTPYFITHRETIEAIHSHTEGFKNLEDGVWKDHTNSQVLANLLVVFVQNSDVLKTVKVAYEDGIAEDAHNIVKNNFEWNNETQDEMMVSIGIASGYLNLTATMLGYSTGCCQCYDVDPIKELLGIIEKPILMMGVGFKDDSRNRRQHHVEDGFLFPTFSKKIEVVDI